MTTQKQELKGDKLCKHCGQPIFYYDGEWWHGTGKDGYDKCIDMPVDCYAEPEED